jgi:hypothetical protein
MENLWSDRRQGWEERDLLRLEQESAKIQRTKLFLRRRRNELKAMHWRSTIWEYVPRGKQKQ